MVFTRWPREDSFPFSLALGGKCRRLSRFCNIILLQDLTPLHVKIKRSTNLWSVCRRKLKLSTYLNTVSYSHISFLNIRSELGWVLASSGFYWVFDNMKNDNWICRLQNSFSKIASVQRKPFSLVGVISSVSWIYVVLGNSSTAPVFSYNQINKQPENLYVNYREYFGYFTQLAETSLFWQCNPSS